MVTSAQKARFAQLLKKEKSFLISGHHGPDGDVIGSTLALTLALKKLGKKALAYNADGCPMYLQFLPQSKMFISSVPKNFDGILITVDSGSFERLGPQIAQHKFKKVWNIDHHQSNTRFGDENFIDVKAGSTGEVVFGLLEGYRGFKLTRDIAVAIFCTLSTDTGSFRYAHATASVFALASKLVRAGARPEAISEPLYDTYPKVRLALMHRVLGSLKYSFNERVAKTYLTLNDLEETGASQDDADSFVNLARGADGVKISCFLREKERGSRRALTSFKKNKNSHTRSAGEWTLSLRSRGHVNVLPIAQHFGGGGHKQAAGCTIHGQLKDIERQLDEILRKKYFT